MPKVCLFSITFTVLFTHTDLAQALVELGKTQHRMCLLPDSFDSLNQALHISKRHFGEDHPQVRTCSYVR